MYRKDTRNPMIGLGISTAMAAVLLTGCAGSPAPRAAVAAADAQQAMQRGHTSEAIQQAELAVTAEPRNATYRQLLGNAYLEEGRFASASTTFQDAMALGDNSPRAALSLALALTGEGRFAEASSLLRDWEGEIAAGRSWPCLCVGRRTRARHPYSFQRHSPGAQHGEGSPEPRLRLCRGRSLARCPPDGGAGCACRSGGCPDAGVGPAYPCRSVSAPRCRIAGRARRCA